MSRPSPAIAAAGAPVTDPTWERFRSNMPRHMLGLFNGRPGARRWRRFLTERAVQPDANESVLRFAFAPTEDAEQDTAPQGDVPFETPQQQPEPVADYQPSGLPSLRPSPGLF